jgi:hypothetical protein
MKAGKGQGTVYPPTGRDGKPTRWYWLKYRFPGDPKPRREPTSPRTDDEQEARRQLHARFAEVPIVRTRRLNVENLLVQDLLAFFVADCEDHGRPVPSGHIPAWMHVLGSERAIDVERDHLDTICRRWRKVGVTWATGRLERTDGTGLKWAAGTPPACGRSRRQRPTAMWRRSDGPTASGARSAGS